MKGPVRKLAFAVLVAIFAIVLGADFVAPAAYDQQFRDHPNAPVSRQFPLGSDDLGRDRLSRLLYGARVSLLLAPAAALLAIVAAAAVGGVAGWAGGWLDRVLMASTDLLMSIPWLFLLITVRAMLPLNTAPVLSIAVTFALLGCLGWSTPARSIRAGVQSLQRSDFLMQATASGASPARLLVMHVLPNLKPLIGAQFWAAIPAFLLAEANLSLLGLGVAEPMPSLGNMLRELEHIQEVRHNPVLLAPLAILVVLVMCCHVAFEQRVEVSR